MAYNRLACCKRSNASGHDAMQSLFGLVQVLAMTESKESNLNGSLISEATVRALYKVLPEILTNQRIAVPFSAYIRELRERLHPKGKTDVRLIKIDNGKKFYVDLGDRLGCDFYYGYFQEFAVSIFFEMLLLNNDIVFDVGANFGYYSVIAGKKMQPGGKVYSFEPNSGAYSLLMDNIRINNLEGMVNPFPICIGNYDGETDFFVTEESSFSGMRDTKRSTLRGKIRLPVRSIDSICMQNRIQKIDVLKIDVEGLEYQVLEGARDIIRKSGEILIMCEASLKNMDKQNIKSFQLYLNDLESANMRIWGLLDDQIVHVGGSDIFQRDLGNLIITHKGSLREKRLMNVAPSLKKFDFQTSFHKEKEGQINCELSQIEFISQHTINFEKVISQRDEMIFAFQEKLKNLEVEGQARLKTIDQLGQRLKDTEADSSERLKIIKMLEKKILLTSGQLKSVEADSNERLKLIRRLEAQILKLRSLK